MQGVAGLFKRTGNTDGASAREPGVTSRTNTVRVEELAMYDADNDGKIDAVERTLAKYDLNHDGKFSAAEVKTICAEVLVEKKTKRKYQFLSAVLCVSIAVLLGAMFGAAVLAGELSKEAFVDSETGVQLGADGQPARTTGARPHIELHDKRRRRLVEHDGRRLVEVAEVNSSVMSSVLKLMNTSGQTQGTVEVGSSNARRRSLRQLAEVTPETLYATGELIRSYVKRINGQDETWYVFRSGVPGDSALYTVTGDGQVLQSDPNVNDRLRRLSEDESLDDHERRRLHEAGGAPRPEPCLIYHCFEGDARCSDPAPRSLCKAWSADDEICDEPACAYVVSSAVPVGGRRRLSTADPVTACTITADCQTGNANKLQCFNLGGGNGTGTCIECVTNADCESLPHGCYLEQGAIPERLCDLSNGECVQCLQDSDCDAVAGAGSNHDFFCDTGAGRCVECVTAGDCDGNNGDGYHCTNEGFCLIPNCFPAHATVTTPAGPKRMDALELGDRVLVDGGAAYSTVYLSAHEDRRSTVQHAFVRVELSSGHALELSSDHLARLAQGAYVRADDVRVGMVMSVVDSGGGGGAVSAAVTSVSEVQRVGLYAPITLHGDIVVNGVVASAYASILKAALPPPLRRSGTLLHALAHVLAAPMRALHAAEPAVLAHIMKTTRRTESGGFDLYALTGPGGLLAIKEAIDSGLATAAAQSVPRRALALAATYGGLMVVASIAGAANTLGFVASSVTTTSGAMTAAAAVLHLGGASPSAASCAVPPSA